MLVGRPKGRDVARSNFTWISEVPSPPSERLCTKGDDEQIGRRPAVTSVPVREGMNRDHLIVKPSPDLVHWPSQVLALDPSGYVTQRSTI